MRQLLPFVVTLGLCACAVQKSQAPSHPQSPEPTVAPATPATTAPGQPGYTQQAQPGNVIRVEGGEDFASVEDAERELERARGELDAFGVTKSSGGKKGNEAAPLSRGDAACGNACKAFASLRRAADAVCRLTSEGDARCVRARTLVKENESRVSACGCEPVKE